MPDKQASHRPDVLDGASLHYAPENELGVVYLFAELAKRWRLRIDRIQAAFPDCLAYQKTQRGERRIRIEFEYRSSSFKLHQHPVRGCDWVVCWEHDWPDAPSSLNFIELRREFGLGFNVWVTPVNDPYKEVLKSMTSGRWTVASQANKGDLQVLYLTAPQRQIGYVYRLRERPRYLAARYKSGRDYFARISRVCRLDAPIFLEDLRSHRALSTAAFVRGKMRNRYNATEHWPFLYDMIIRRNPKARRTLSRYAPQAL